MIISAIICIIAGALLWLDRVFMLQILVSRPIVMSAILGLVAGDLQLGLLIGASLELIWLNAPPVGAFLPYDESFCTAVAIPVGILAGNSMEPQAASGLALFLSLPTALVGRWIDSHIRRANQRLLPEDVEEIEHALQHAMFKALGRAFLYALGAIAACTMILGFLIFFIGERLPAALVDVLSYLPFLCILIGLSSLFGGRGTRSKTAWTGAFILGVVVVILWTWAL